MDEFGVVFLSSADGRYGTESTHHIGWLRARGETEKREIFFMRHFLCGCYKITHRVLSTPTVVPPLAP